MAFAGGFGASEGVSECSGLVWCSKWSILGKLGKAKFYTLDTFEKSKYQNLPKSFQVRIFTVLLDHPVFSQAG